MRWEQIVPVDLFLGLNRQAVVSKGCSPRKTCGLKPGLVGMQGNFEEGEDPDDYEGESDGDSDASDDAAAGRGEHRAVYTFHFILQMSSFNWKERSCRSISDSHQKMHFETKFRCCNMI